jgi:hypothetical protein
LLGLKLGMLRPLRCLHNVNQIRQAHSLVIVPLNQLLEMLLGLVHCVLQRLKVPLGRLRVELDRRHLGAGLVECPLILQVVGKLWDILQVI